MKSIKNILAIGCHPDDIEIACGGTLAKYANAGHNVYLCNVANGNLGHKLIMPEQLREIRMLEAQNAGKRLGAKEVVSLDVGDLYVNSNNEETVRKLVDLVRRFKPDIIITHSPNDYMRDHVEVSRLVFNASFSASIPNYITENKPYENIPAIYYMDTLSGIDFQPEFYVDISDYIDIKLDSLNLHTSQIKWMLEHDKVDFIDFVRTCSKYRGLQSGAKYSEGFTQCKTWPRMRCSELL